MIAFVLVVSMLGLAGVLRAQQSPFGDLQVCANCHSNISVPAGAVDVANVGLHPRTRTAAQPTSGLIGPTELWPGSMMAHSARDPYWLAKVRFETGENPALKEVIEDTCLRCHAPMQQYEFRVAGARMALDDLEPVGRQGVGCTVCHQITPQGLGTRETFEGEFHINDSRFIYGPHASPFAMPMQNNSGYTPVEGRQILESSLCATCHTVITPSVDAAGNVVGEFVEQAPYLEWLVSDSPARGQTCQSCHMPVLNDTAGRPVSTHIAHRPNGLPFPPTSPRSPFGQHFITGGNAPMLRLAADAFPEEAAVLSANLERTREFLATAITLRMEGDLDGNELEIETQVTNNTGHKLPTGFPSRRIWLHLTVTDRDGDMVFESGAWDPASGEILGIRELEPHRREIEDHRQVMIYEAEMEDTDGNVTATLLRGAGYRKDNRLLPRGFDLGRPLPAGIEPDSIAPAGVDGDEDFRPGSHEVTYKVLVSPDSGPFRVRLEALYQNVKPSHVVLMDPAHSAEEARFVDLFRTNSAPAAMARAEILVRER